MKNFKIFFLIIFISIIISSGFFYYTYNYFNSTYLKNDYFLIIKNGESFNGALDKLIKNNVINPNGAKIFYYSTKIIYKNKIDIKAGEYKFSKTDTPLMILKKLKNGDVFYRKLTFAEGLSNNSIFKILNSSFGLFGDIPNNIEEGSLMPETYLYTYGETKKEILDRMQKSMTDFVNSEWEKRAINLPFKTKEETISLASIVEKETGIKEERGKVASVFINRIKIGMRLQSDPTVVYGFAFGNKDLEREIRKSDLARATEYNTYLIYGIPKKPICNPGKDAIRATLNPEKTNYLYFVATGNGGHNFSTNLKEHNIFVKTYRKIINLEKN